MKDIRIDQLQELDRLLDEGRTTEAREVVQALTRQARSDRERADYVDRWLGSFLDDEHRYLLAHMDGTSGDRIRAMERHVRARNELLELAMHAGDLAEEIARTYELLDDDGAAVETTMENIEDRLAAAGEGVRELV